MTRVSSGTPSSRTPRSIRTRTVRTVTSPLDKIVALIGEQASAGGWSRPMRPDLEIADIFRRHGPAWRP
jgi:hypothetical protein